MKQETKLLPVKRMIQKNAVVPKIVLSGDWLSKAGFEPGDSALVVIYKNTLLIRNVRNDKDE